MDSIMILIYQVQNGYHLIRHLGRSLFSCLSLFIAQNFSSKNMRLVAMLERLRAALGGRPVAVSPGYRCPAHNRAVGGAPESQHLPGNAADTVVSEVSPERVAAKAEVLKFPGVGRYPSFTHVDVRPNGPARWIDVR